MRLWNKILAGTMAAIVAFSSLPVQAGHVRAEEIVQKAADRADYSEEIEDGSIDAQEIETHPSEEISYAVDTETEVQEEKDVEVSEADPQETEDETESTEMATPEETDTEEVESETEEIETVSELTTEEESIIANGDYKNITWFIDDAGKLTVTGTGDFSDSNWISSAPWDPYRESIKSAEINVTGMSNAMSMFRGCSSLTSLDLSSFDTSNVTDMRFMFFGCSSLESVDMSGINTSRVTNMMSMFRGCSSLTSLDLSSFDTSNVTDMSFMFYDCSSLESVDMSSFDTSKVTDMSHMLRSCSNLRSLNMSGINTSKVTDMSHMFRNCSSLTSLDLSGINTSRVTNMRFMFRDCSNLKKLDISDIDTGNVICMAGMFMDCSSLTNLDLSSFDTGNVQYNSKYSGTTSDAFDDGGMVGMFSGCSSLTSLDLSSFDTSKVTDMSFMFNGCSSLINLDVSDMDTGNVKCMVGMFSGCSSLTSLDVGGFNTSNVQFSSRYWLINDHYYGDDSGMSKMFSGCSSLTSLDLSSFDTSKVTDMRSMFSGCSSLTSLDLSSFDAGAAYKASQEVDPYKYQISDMFSDCSKLTSIYIPYNIIVFATLPSGSWYQPDGTQISTLPRGLSYSILITKGHVPSVDSVSIKAAKSKTVYKCGGILHTDDLTVRCYDTEGTVRKVTDYTTNADQIDMQTPGIKTLIVTYRGYTAEVQLKVGEVQIIKTPVKISGITVSDSVYTGRPFSYTGTAVATTDTGSNISTELALTYTYNGTMADGSAYKASTAAPVNAGDYTLTVEVPKGNKNYTGSVSYQFKITPAPVTLTAEDVTLAVGGTLPDTFAYQLTGLADGDKLIKEPSFVCTDTDGNEISSESISTGQPGSYYIVPKDAEAGMNYEITYQKGTLTIRNGEKEAVEISGITMPDSVYNGKPVAYNGTATATTQAGNDITDQITLNYSYSGTMADGSSYEASQAAPVNAGNYVLTIAVSQDDKDYTGSREYSFEISKAQAVITALDMTFQIGGLESMPEPYPYEVAGMVEGDKLTAEPSFIYTDMDGNEISKDSISLKEAGSYYVIPKEADAGMNYTFSYQKGIFTVEVEKGDKPGDGDNEVLPDDIPENGIPKEGIIWTSAVQDQQYTGAALKPALRVYCGGRLLTEKTDYTLSYKNNKKLGTADITITGKGNYSEKKTVHFNIIPKSLSDKDIIVEDMAYPDDGRQHKAPPMVTYNGKKLKPGTDFTIEYGEGDYTAAGDYYAAITGKGNYTGTVENVKTTIIDKSMFINKAKVAALPKQEYNKGQAIVLPDSALTVMLNGKILEKDTDYTVTYINNCNVGKASVVIKGIGSYAGTKTASFKIVRTPVDISTADISCDYIRETAFTKGGCMPEPKVSYDGAVLKKGVDYTVSYKNNKKAGAASFTVKGKGSFKGSRAFAFTIKQKELSAVDIRIPDTAYANKAGRYGSKPILTDTDGKTLKAGTDYTITGYVCNGETLGRESNPPEGSEITVTVQGIGSYSGSVSASYRLRTGISLGKATITVADQTYTGKAVKPTEDSITGASIKASGKTENLVYGRDYEIIAYGSNIKSGSGTIVLRGLGNYYGEKTIKFKIVKKSVRTE